MDQPNAPDPADKHISRNARYGIFLFLIYLVLYGGFIAITAFDFNAMAKPVIGGVNLAIVYGMGLIVAALVLALVYMWLCRPGDEDRGWLIDEKGKGKDQGGKGAGK